MTLSISSKTSIFQTDEIRAIRDVTPLADDFVDFLTDFRFSGTVRAVPEGTIVFADEPLIEVTAQLDRRPRSSKRCS